VNKNQRYSLLFTSDSLYSDDEKMANSECRKIGIPSTYSGVIEKTSRNTRDRGKVINTLDLHDQRRAAENVIFDKSKKIDLLRKEAGSAEKEIKPYKKLAELDESNLNPEMKIRWKTKAFRAKLRRQEEAFRREAEAFKEREQKMKIELKKMDIEHKKLTKNLAITKRAKADVERKYKRLQKKRNREIQHKNIQKRPRSNLDRLGRKLSSNFDIKQTGEFPIFGTQKEMQLQKRKTPQKFATDIEKSNQNMLSNYEELRVENQRMRTELEDIKQKYGALMNPRDCNGPPQNEWIGPLPYRANADVGASEQGKVERRVYDFHLDRLIDVYTEFTLDSMGDRPSLLRAHPKWEQCIYEQVCYQLGITPVAEHVGSGAVTARSSISETNLARSNLSVHWATPVAEYVGPGAVRARSSITGTKRTGSNLSFPRDDSKNYETQEASKKRLWSDESEMDFLSKKLAKDRSFTESCSAVSANSKCPTLKKSSKGTNPSPYSSTYV